MTVFVAVTQEVLGTTRLEQPKGCCWFLHPLLFPKGSSGAAPYLPSPSSLPAHPAAVPQSSDVTGMGFPPPCHPPAWAEHWALLAAVPWWDSRAPARKEPKSVFSQSAASLRRLKGASEFAPDDPGKSFLGC